MLAEIIPQIAGQDQRKWGYKPRPSSAGPERCLRSMVYNALGIEPKPLPGRSLLKMDDSSWHETLSIDWINKSIYKIHSTQMGLNCLELKSPFLNKSYKCPICKQDVPVSIIHGHIDGILQEPTGTEHLFEHKAINHFTFQGYETGQLVPYDYICQCCLYDESLKKLLGKELDFILLFVKNKNTAQYMEYHIFYDNQTDIAKIEIYRVEFNDEGFPILKFVRETYMENVLKGVKEKFELVDKFYLEKKLPKRQYSYDDWHCQYCGWNDICWKDYDKEILDRKEGIKVSDEIFADVQIFVNYSEEIKKKEKIVDELKEKIKMYMINEQAHTGVAGDYLVRLTQKERKNLDQKLLPVELVQQATKITKYEQIDIKPLVKQVETKTKKGGK